MFCLLTPNMHYSPTNTPYLDLLRASSLVIVDCSSIAEEAAYLGIDVIYYNKRFHSLGVFAENNAIRYHPSSNLHNIKC